MPTETETLVQHIERCYRTSDWDALAEIYTSDVLLDAQVPGWRFQLQGPDAVTGWWKEQVSHFDRFRVTWVRATTTDDGAVVEWEMRGGEPDSEHEYLCREVDVLHGDGERIHTHVISCTGLWDPATIARQKAEAPMVRW